MDWLLRDSDRPDTVRIETRGRTYHLPVGRFDNRVDRTTFIRADRSQWNAEQVKALQEGMAEAFRHLDKVTQSRV